jgi:hypothetical protein
MKKDSLSRKLIALAKRQYGRACSPKSFYMSDPDNERAGNGYCDYYHSSATWDMSFEEWRKVARLSKRYLRFVNYVTEVKPQWKDTAETTMWGDNSVDVVQVSITGQKRTVQVKPPSGDACY